VALNIYTKTALNQRLAAADTLENAVFKGFLGESAKSME